MARVFEDVTLEWDGKPYIIPSNKVMGAIARIEQHVTLNDLANGEGRIKFGAIACAYGSLLRYAGAQVRDDEIYQELFSDGGNKQSAMTTAVAGLMSLILPPAVRQKAETGGTVAGDDQSGNVDRRGRKARAGSSRKSTSW